MIRTVHPKTPPDPVPDNADDRAQPGDVLGLERDGETTELGDTREEENERREDAEEAARAERDRSSE